MDLEKLNRSPWGEGKGEKCCKQRGREANNKRLLNTDNKLRVDGAWERGKWVIGIGGGAYWDEHWVLYASQFGNKLY